MEEEDGSDVEEQKAVVEEQEEKGKGQQPVAIRQEQEENGNPVEAQAPPLPLPAPAPSPVPLWSCHWAFNGWRFCCDECSTFSVCVSSELFRDGWEGRRPMTWHSPV